MTTTRNTMGDDFMARQEAVIAKQKGLREVVRQALVAACDLRPLGWTP